MTRLRLVALILPLLLTACTHHAPGATVEVIDTSMSITPRAERTALDAIRGQISRLGRGDRLILVPITGDAQNDAGGRILRLTVPSAREAYDADLTRFRADADKQFTAWVASLDAHQTRTDILGTLDIVRQEFAALPDGYDRRLLIVSDFLQDDTSYRFISTPALNDPSHARQLAHRLRDERGFTLTGVSACLGRLESSDFAPLSPQRKEAVMAFWTEYLSDGGRPPGLRFDGTGMLAGDAGCLSGSTIAPERSAAAGRNTR